MVASVQVEVARQARKRAASFCPLTAVVSARVGIVGDDRAGANRGVIVWPHPVDGPAGWSHTVESSGGWAASGWVADFTGTAATRGVKQYVATAPAAVLVTGEHQMPGLHPHHGLPIGVALPRDTVTS